jgi:hypothetical protein
MKTLTLVLALAACGGGSKKSADKPAEPLANTAPTATAAATPAPPPQTETQRVMTKFHEFADAMCACKDADCAKRVSDDMTAWSQEQAKAAKEPLKMSEDEQKQAVEIGTHMGECMQAAMGMNSGATP